MHGFENTKQHGGGKTACKLNGRDKASNIIKFNQKRIGPSLNPNFLPDFWKVLMRPEIINL